MPDDRDRLVPFTTDPHLRNLLWLATILEAYGRGDGNGVAVIEGPLVFDRALLKESDAIPDALSLQCELLNAAQVRGVNVNLVARRALNAMTREILKGLPGGHLT